MANAMPSLAAPKIALACLVTGAVWTVAVPVRHAGVRLALPRARSAR